jgi:hypothetical protein
MVGLRGVIRQGLTGWCRGWIPLNQPETRVIVKNKRDQSQIVKEKVDDYCLRRVLARLPYASSAARRRLLLLAMLLGFALAGKRRLEIGEDLRAKGLVESWGHLRFSFIGLTR